MPCKRDAISGRLIASEAKTFSRSTCEAPSVCVYGISQQRIKSLKNVRRDFL